MRSRTTLQCLLLILVTLTLGCRPQPPVAAGLFDVPLSTLDGSLTTLASLKGSRASVLVFLAPDCPLSQKYTLTLSRLREQFQPLSMEFAGIVPGEWYDATALRTFADTYKIEFPILRDTDFRLTRALHALVTPEVFVIDSAGQLIYQGAIDNWADDLTRHRTTITEHYLRDALASAAQGEPAPLSQTRAVGCFIETSERL